MQMEWARWILVSLGALFVCSSNARATDIAGTISTTLTITEDSQLVDDVTCTVTGAACIALMSGVTLDLNGFTVTGLADPETGCSGASTGSDAGILVNAQTGVTIRGPGVVQRFRSAGIFSRMNSIRTTVTGVTLSTNCASGILVGGGSDHLLEGNVSVRNGSATPGFSCGGIWLNGGVSRSRLRANRLSGNGYSATQNDNFGIGLHDDGTNDNVVEDNIIVGNTNGIEMTATVQGNIIRRNLVVGNPPVQMAVDYAANVGYDIKNKAPVGANVFHNNVCLTSLNAPCPAPFESSLTASPNPIPVTGAAMRGITTISWIAPGVEAVEVRIGSPNGVLFVGGGSRGSVQTGLWVPDGMTFYLQDISGGKGLTEENTLAMVVVRLQRR